MQKDGSCASFALAVDFAIEIVKYLLGDEKADELKAGILYKG